MNPKMIFGLICLLGLAFAPLSATHAHEASAATAFAQAPSSASVASAPPLTVDFTRIQYQCQNVVRDYTAAPGVKRPLWGYRSFEIDTWISNHGEWLIRRSQVTRPCDREIVVPSDWIDADIIRQIGRLASAQVVSHAHHVGVDGHELVLCVGIAGEQLQRPGRMSSAGVRHRP